MLAEERHSIIVDTVNQQRSVRLTDLCVLLDASEATVRRDLNILDEKKLLSKVHGGAIALDENQGKSSLAEPDVAERSQLFSAEKEAIARYAAALIEDNDFVFIDAGTTTEKMIDFIPAKKAAFVTNGIIHAKKLAQRGFKVYIPAGEIRLVTEAIVGSECVLSIQSYNFTKSFIGANGISISSGFTTPDKNEASVKKAVISNSGTVYVLADHSKFDKVTSVTFARLSRIKIITDKLPDRKYLSEASVKEVL